MRILEQEPGMIRGPFPPHKTNSLEAAFCAKRTWRPSYGRARSHDIAFPSMLSPAPGRARPRGRERPGPAAPCLGHDPSHATLYRTRRDHRTRSGNPPHVQPQTLVFRRSLNRLASVSRSCLRPLRSNSENSSGSIAGASGASGETCVHRSQNTRRYRSMVRTPLILRLRRFPPWGRSERPEIPGRSSANCR